MRRSPLQSNSVSDYIPNLTLGRSPHADIVIAAGFLLANAMATMAKKFPDTHFAITDYRSMLRRSPTRRASRSSRTSGPDLRLERGWMPRRRARGEEAQQMGTKIIGAVGGLKIPPVDIWIAGYRFCAQKAVPGTRCWSATRRTSSRPTSARRSPQNQIAQGAQVLFQVAGGCGLGTLKAADEAGIWGIGVDVDQYALGEARPDERRQARRQRRLRRRSSRCKAGKFAGGTDLVFNLKNNGVGVGKINPAVPAGVHHADEQLQGADHRRHAQGPCRALGVRRPSEGEGRAERPAPRRAGR